MKRPPIEFGEVYVGSPPAQAPILTYPAWLKREQAAERRRRLGRLLGSILLAGLLALTFAGSAYMWVTAP